MRLDNNGREDEIYDAKQAFEAIIIGQNLTDPEEYPPSESICRLSIRLAAKCSH